MKYLKLRLFLLSLEDVIHFRFFKYANSIKQDFKNEDVYEVASFSTNIRWRPELGKLNTNRIENMEKCAEKINGMVLKPNTYFSLMKAIGNPSLKRGFKTGPVVVRGELKYIEGGGLCQVSTTLFNMALKSGLKVVKKHNHTWDIWGENRFIDLGRDASFVYARKDLVFKNNYKEDIILHMHVDKDALKLNMSVFSCSKIDVKTKIKSVILEDITDLSKDILSRGYHVETVCLCDWGHGEKRTFYKKEKYKPRYKG